MTVSTRVLGLPSVMIGTHLAILIVLVEIDADQVCCEFVAQHLLYWPIIVNNTKNNISEEPFLAIL